MSWPYRTAITVEVRYTEDADGHTEAVEQAWLRAHALAKALDADASGTVTAEALSVTALPVCPDCLGSGDIAQAVDLTDAVGCPRCHSTGLAT